MRLRLRATLLFLLFTSLLVTAIWVVLVSQLIENTYQTKLTALQSQAKDKGTQVELLLEGNANLVSAITSRTKLRTTLVNLLETPENEESLQTVDKILSDAQAPFPELEFILLLSPTLSPLTSTITLPPDDIQTYSDILTDDDSTSESLIVKHVDDTLVLFDRIYLEDTLLGTAVVGFSDQPLLSLITNVTYLGETGETLLAERAADDAASFLHVRRFESDLASLPTIPSHRLDVPMTQALRGNEISMRDSIDYRGHPVLAATAYLDLVDWGLVSKIDLSEVHYELFALAVRLILLSLLSVLVLSLLVYASFNLSTRSLSRLTDAANSITKGDFDLPVTKETFRGSDEISQLGTAFLTMVDTVKHTQSTLEDAVKMRTQELEGKIHESERLMRHMEGREARMAELKKSQSKDTPESYAAPIDEA